MGKKESNKKSDAFREALEGKRVPVLTLDQKWYRLLDEVGRRQAKALEEELNRLIKRQGKLNTETQEYKKLKRKLMREIVPMVDEAEQGNRAREKDIREHRRLVEDCNAKLEAYQEELMELPGEIDRVNKELMVQTMERCYDIMQQYTEEIAQIDEWVRQIRVELKKRLIRKQEMEARRNLIYSYMHDVFGVDVVDLFDIEYDMGGASGAVSGDGGGDEAG